MSREYDIHDAKNLIWRNLPTLPGTFAACSRGCGQSARGGGVCLNCAQADLAKLTNELLARQYVATVLNLRRLEREMLDFRPPDLSEKHTTISDINPQKS
jgi:hypothetical protein